MITSVTTKFRQVVLGCAAAILLPAAVLAGQPPAPATTSSISFDPASVSDGQTLNVIGTLVFSSDNSPVVGTALHIDFKQSSGLNFDPNLGVDCNTSGTFVSITPNENTDSNGQVTKSFNTTGFGGRTFCFQAHHPADGTRSGQSSGENSIYIDPVSTCLGPKLVNKGVSSPGHENDDGSITGPWTVTLELNNCTGTPLTFKVQGGANAWAPLGEPNSGAVLVSSKDKDVEFKVNKKNTVIIWTVTTSGKETISFRVGDGVTLPCGPIQQSLTGNWSAAYTDPNTGLPTKTDYTDQATVTSGVCQ